MSPETCATCGAPAEGNRLPWAKDEYPPDCFRCGGRFDTPSESTREMLAALSPEEREVFFATAKLPERRLFGERQSG